MNENPVCTYKYYCIYQRNKKCTILNAMPKPRKDNTCPFAKRHPSDIAGKVPCLKKGAERDQKKANSFWHIFDPVGADSQDHSDESGGNK